MAVALAPRTVVCKVRSNSEVGGRVVFNMKLSPWHRVHSSDKFAAASRMETGAFLKCGSRLAARTFIPTVFSEFKHSYR
eukprot:6698224-Pyramimonas_sp.AAC.1